MKRRFKIIGRGVIALLAGILVSVSHLGSANTSVDVVSEGANDRVRIAMLTTLMHGMDPADAKMTMDRILGMAWFDEVAFESFVYRDNGSFYTAIADGEADLIPMLIEDYLKKPNSCKIDAVLQGVGDDNGGTELVLLTSSDKELKDLASAKVRVDSSQQMTGMWLDVLLSEEGLPTSDRFFGPVVKADRSSSAVLPVFFGQADLCVTSKQAFDVLSDLNPQLKKDLRVLAVSPPFAAHLICLHSEFDDPRRDMMIDSMLKLHTSGPGKQIMLLAKVHRISRCDPAHIESAQRLHEQWKRIHAPVADEGSEKAPVSAPPSSGSQP